MGLAAERDGSEGAGEGFHPARKCIADTRDAGFQDLAAQGAYERKADLRKRMKALRAAMPQQRRSAADAEICARTCAHELFEKADTVFAYLSFGTEVDTYGIIRHAWKAGKRVALPRCTGPRQMRWFIVESFEGLQESPLGVLEPALDESRELSPESDGNKVALVPGLAFDDAGYRLGYGGGFYDAFLARFTGHSLGLCRTEQRIADLLPLGVIAGFDLPVDEVVFDGVS